MSLLNNFVVLGILIACSAFLSMSEISIAAARKIKLQLLLAEGKLGAQKVLTVQDQAGNFFAATQIGLNAVAILGGILGQAAFTPYIQYFISQFYNGDMLGTISFVLSFIFVTSLFILFADLMPKRIAMTAPEQVSIRLVSPLLFFIKICTPLILLINGAANALFKLFKISTVRNDAITYDDIYAMVDAGAQTGAIHKQEFHLIENVFELESRTVPSSMTSRESIIYFTLQESNDSLKQKIAAHPHSKFLICDQTIDTVIGYVDTKDILLRMINNQPLAQIYESNIRAVLMIPDSLTLSELLARFKATREDFAAVINEYALVVGVITLNDIMSTVMGNLVSQSQEEQVMQRDENSWLVDGATPIGDVKNALGLEFLPDDDNYETIAGFIMYMLRKIPKLTDFVEFAGFKFEVVDIDHYKIDQLLVTRIIIPSQVSEETHH
ncbi:MAG: HlyC/CorC family transporter [Candidatus Saccharibacteria bacterium]|nr:HlyC/CorC family transporter [Moraxellaceae bacterium]